MTFAVMRCCCDGSARGKGVAACPRDVGRVDEIIPRGKHVYVQDPLVQEAWSLAVANRNFVIEQYDEVNRELTWLTLERDLPEWRESLTFLFAEARTAIEFQGP